ncbi:MAG: diacylglycerol kinase family lipid kinase [Oscillospiraceae bacterium]|nr:diacylglycerol kinase family lipid kinase [Oscillospiraceae bacterium]
MKHLFIVNPTAGGSDKTDEVRARVVSAFAQRPDEEVEIYVTKAPLDATEKIRAEAADGKELRVYACGGDGTFNECAAGVLGHANAAVCPFPTGTGNDFCRMFGAEKDLFRDLDALLEGRVHPIDAIDCNGRCSVNICSAGIDARIGTNVHKYTDLPLVGGAAGYVVSAAVEMFRGISQPMRIRSGDYAGDGDFTLVCVCNGRFYGGGFNPSLDARPDDGELDIFIARKVNLLQFASLIGKYASGHAAELTKLVTHLRAQEITIEFDGENVINLDGEAYFTDRAVMRLLPGAVNLIVPKGMRFFD